MTRLASDLIGYPNRTENVIASVAVMNSQTNTDLHSFVSNALRQLGANESTCQRMAVRAAATQAFGGFRTQAGDGINLEIVAIGATSKQAVRTSGAHVNVFALAGVAWGVAFAPMSTLSSIAVLIAILGACTVSITPEQAAFFIAAEQLKSRDKIPTAKALSAAVAVELNDDSYDVSKLLNVVNQLKYLGVSVTIGPPPNYVVRHSEWTISIPNF